MSGHGDARNPTERHAKSASGLEPPVDGHIFARNALVNLLGQILPLLVGLFTVPFLLERLGTEAFGLLALSWSVVGYFTIFDLGISRATTRFSAQALANDGLSQVSRILGTSAVIQVGFSVLCSAGLYWGSGYIASSLLNVSPESTATAAAVLRMIAIGIPAVQTTSIAQGALEAAQRFDLVNYLRIPAGLANYILPMVGTAVGLSLPTIVFLMVGVRVLLLLGFVIILERVFPGLVRGARFDRALLRPLVSFGGWLTVSSITGPVLEQLDRLVISTVLSVRALAFYSAPFELVGRMVIIPISLTRVLYPAFSYRAAQQPEAVREMFSRPLKYLLFVLTPLSAVLIVFADDILTVWLGAEFATASATPFRLLVLAVFINSLAQIPFTVVQGMGRPDLKAKLDLAEVFLYGGLCIYLVPTWGLTGAALARLIISAVDMVALFGIGVWVARLRFEQIGSRECNQTVLIGGAFAAACFVVSFCIEDRQTCTFISLCLGVIHTWLFARIAMDNEDWSAVRGIFSKALRSISK